jgi:lysozyme
MKLSQQGAGAVLGHEAIILQAYLDPVNVWTIGAGHTAAAGGPAPRSGMVITLAQATSLFLADMAKFEARVDRAIRQKNQHEFDGLTSFDFNTGAISSGSVDDKWNRGDRAAAVATLQAYVNAKGKRLAGLVTRRAEEAAIITAGRYPDRKILVKDRIGAQGRLMTVDQLPWGAGAPLAMDIDAPLVAPVPMPARRPPKQNFLLDLARAIGRVFSWT